MYIDLITLEFRSEAAYILDQSPGVLFFFTYALLLANWYGHGAPTAICDKVVTHRTCFDCRRADIYCYARTSRVRCCWAICV